MNFTTNAINLKSYDFSDFDRILIMFSKERGILKGIAKGAKKPKSILRGRLEMLEANNFLLYQGKNLNKITQAETINSFSKIRGDIDKLFYAVYCGELIYNFGTENDPNSEEIYDLLYKTLEKISNASNKTEIIFATLKFQLKIMLIVGYCPEFELCVFCGKKVSETKSSFSIEQGGIACECCKNKMTKFVNIHKKIRDFLTCLINTEPDKSTPYDNLIGEVFVKKCFNFMNDYINEHSNKQIKSVKMLDAV